MSNTLTDLQHELVDKVAVDHQFRNYDVDIKSASAQGDNFLGVVSAVTVKERNSDKVLNLFMKCAQKSDALRQTIPISSIFERESTCYERLFPQYRRLHKDKGAQCEFPVFAVYYGNVLSEKEECLLLCNMKEDGYSLWDRKKHMDDDHTALVVRNYGKVHALSFALKDHEPEAYAQLEQYFKKSPFEESFKEEDGKHYIHTHFEKMYQMLEDRKDNLLESMKRFEDGVWDLLLGAPKEYTAITHGDCWCNNILFKYEDDKNPKKPTKLCFIDWQLCRVASPVVDLSYFLFTCATMENIYNYKKYLKIYHDSLSEMLVDLGCDPQKLFPYSELEKQWTTYCKFGLYMAMMVTKIMMSESGEAPNLEEFADSGKDIMTVFNYTASCEERYKRRMIDLIKFFVDNNYL